MLQPGRVFIGRSANQAMHDIAQPQKQFSEVGAILAGNTGDERSRSGIHAMTLAIEEGHRID